MENNKKTHWLQSPNKNYLGHWDLPGGKDLILTIKSAQWEEVKNPIINKSEAKRVVRFEEDVKPWICNQTNAQAILKVIGIKFMEDSAGKKIQLGVSSIIDRRTKDPIDCIRVRTEVPNKELPELNPDSPKWEGAKKAMTAGSVTIAAIKKQYSITPKNEKLLCSK